MYYADLEYYQIYGKYYKNNINIGWLDANINFEKGKVDKQLVEKLKYLTSLVNEQDKWKMTHPSGIVVHRMFVSRGLPHACPFCKEEVKLLVNNKEIVLGYNEMAIPSKDLTKLYIFPTLLYHYIKTHNYKPPTEFLEAIESFDLSQPFNCQDFD